jgi:hypothetical protein
MQRRPALVASALLLAGCDPAPDQTDEIRERLVGTWLRDYVENGTHVRRVLVLGPDGHFQEASRSLGPQEAGVRHAHEGEWLFDGTNLKRRYTLMDGQPVSAPQMPFVAFQVRFTGSHEFSGTDNVRQREVRYHRVPAGTEP